MLLLHGGVPAVQRIDRFRGRGCDFAGRLFNTHPTGAALKRERLTALMGDGGIQECGYAQNCVEICPKDIPLTKSISEVGRDVMKQAVGDLFRR